MMPHKPVRVDQTVSQRARQRATESRLRAIYHEPSNGQPYYVVYNLKQHHKYIVWLSLGVWRCTCEAGKAGTRCKHVQRVLDREERRVKQEALAVAE